MARWLIILTTVSVFFACKSRKSTALPDPIYFSVETTPCFGACPVYIMNFDQTGSVEYIAVNFTEDIGEFKLQEDSTAILLVSDAKGFNWSNYEKEYLTNYSDLPSVIFKYSEQAGDTIKVRFEVEAGPKELVELYNRVERLRTSANWSSTIMH